MARVHYKEEQIIAKLRKADLLFSEGKSKSEVCKSLEVTAVTLARWQNKYGGFTVAEAKRLKELEKENARLKRIVADQAIDICVLKDFAKGNL